MPRVWLCADLTACPADDLVARARAVCAVCEAVVWVRSAREIPAGIVLDVTRAMSALGARVVVGDRADVGRVAGVGVHLGTRSIAVVEARALGAAYVSAAVHDRREIDAARGADALVLSPLFDVPGKNPALGVAEFERLAGAARGATVVALGGIDSVARVREIRGADAFAIRRAWIVADDPAATVRAMLDAFSA